MKRIFTFLISTFFVIIASTQTITDRASLQISENVETIKETKDWYKISTKSYGLPDETTFVLKLDGVLKSELENAYSGRIKKLHHYDIDRFGNRFYKGYQYEKRSKKGKTYKHDYIYQLKGSEPDTLFQYKVTYQGNFKDVDTLDYQDVIKFDKKGNKKWQKEYSFGRLRSETKYYKNKIEKTKYKNESIFEIETSVYKNNVLQKQEVENADGSFKSAKEYLYDDIGNLSYIYLTDKSGKRIDIQEAHVYLYKGNDWVIKLRQLYQKPFYGQDRLGYSIRKLILKDGTQVKLTDVERDTFVKKHLKMAVKPDKF